MDVADDMILDRIDGHAPATSIGGFQAIVPLAQQVARPAPPAVADDPVEPEGGDDAPDGQMESRVRALLQASPDPIIATDREGRIVLVNTRAARLFGYRREELVGQPVELLVPERSRDAHLRKREAYAAAPVPRMMGSGLDLTARRKDGTEFPVDISLSPTETAGGLLVTCVVRDISESKRRQAHERFLAEAGALLLASLDYQSTLSQVARLSVPGLADCAVVDALDGEGRPQRLGVAHRDPSEDAALREQADQFPPLLHGQTVVARALRRGTTVVFDVVTDSDLGALAHDEGHVALIRRLAPRSMLFVPLVARGRTVGVLALLYTTSGRRYGPDERALIEEFARRAALAVDNAHLYGRAQEAIAGRDQFLRGVSHDMRNPLTLIKVITHMLSTEMDREAQGGAPTQAWKDALGDIDGAVGRLNALVGELLDLARLQAGRRLELHRVPTDLIGLASGVVRGQQHAATRHTIRLEATLDRIVGDWDRERLERVIDNLVDNAVKYSPGGGDVLVRASVEGDAWAVLEVHDQGIGIPKDDLPHIFDPFRRGRNVAGLAGGTGIGLATVRQIVAGHGGTVGVVSAEARGTRVTIRLPLRRAEGEATAGGDV